MNHLFSRGISVGRAIVSMAVDLVPSRHLSIHPRPSIQLIPYTADPNNTDHSVIYRYSSLSSHIVSEGSSLRDIVSPVDVPLQLLSTARAENILPIRGIHFTIIIQ